MSMGLEIKQACEMVLLTSWEKSLSFFKLNCPLYQNEQVTVVDAFVDFRADHPL